MHAGLLAHAPQSPWAGGSAPAPHCHHGLRAFARPQARRRPAARPAAAPQPLVVPAAAAAARSDSGSSGEEPAGPSAEVLAYLRQRGVDLSQRRLVWQEELGQVPPANCQQPQSDSALSHLTLSLARLLAELLAGRAGVQLQSDSPTAGEYAARLVFLAREVGLPADEIRQKYAAVRNLGFSLASARGTLQWLRRQLSLAEVQALVRVYPKLWTHNSASLEANKHQLQQLLGLTDAQWTKATRQAPQLLFSPARAEEMAAWLQRGPARLSWEEVRELFRTNPKSFSYSSKMVGGKLRLITDLCGLGPEDVKHIVTKCTASFNQSEEKLTTTITTLLSRGFTGQQVAKILRSARALFTFDLEGKVLPLLAELERLLGGDRDAAIAVATKGGALFNISADLLRFNFGWLVTRGGLSEGQARALLQRAPVVFTWDFAGATFQTKLAYWQDLLPIPLPELLERHAPYLKEGLGKVDRRVYAMEQRGELHRLLGGLGWTSLSDKKFERRFGLPPVAEDDEGWQASQRLQQFGLLELGKPNQTRVKTGPKAWRRELGLE